MTAPQRFPSRQYSYRKESGLESLDLPPKFDAQPGAVYRFHMGRDAAPVRMSLDEIRSTLHDPFGRLVLGRARAPQTLAQLLEAVRDGSVETDRFVKRRVFVVADGGQIPWSPQTATLQREFRFLVVLSSLAEAPELYVSTTSPFDSTEAFLQVVGWDSIAGAYQFYDRRGGAWVWAGSSWEALDPACRGKGPFDSHVNGSLNMKELRAPWLHWHSMSAGLRDEALAPNDPLRAEPIWKARESAHLLEQEVVRPGIERWQEARFARRVQGGRVMRLPEFMRQVLGTSTVNIASSGERSASLAAGKRLSLPMGFFLDAALTDELGLDPGIVVTPSVSGSIYLRCLERFEVAITDGKFRFSGDTHFAFPVPEAAYEDTLVLRSLRLAGVLSDKLAASLLMVDFPNPVFSPRRAALLRHVPDSASIGPTSDFEERFVEAVVAAAETLSDDSGERQFLANWRQPGATWRAAFEARLSAHFALISGMMDDAERFERLFALADSRRREFRRRPLHEFKLTTPVSNVLPDAPLLELTEDGRVLPK